MPRVHRDEADIQAAIARRDWKLAGTLLMQEYGNSIYRLCHQMTGDEALASDLLQTTFMQAFVDLERFAGRSLARTWLFSIARHRCVDALKARRRWHSRFVPLDTPAETDSTPDPAALADERMGRRQLVAALEQCLRVLPPPVRMVVYLRFAEGLSYEEIAEICPELPGTLRVRVARAMPVLRRCVEKHGGRIA